jgi:hypothetical protein
LMSEYLYKVLSDPEFAREMGQNGRDYINATFSMERSIGELRKILDHCVARDRDIHEQSLRQSARIATQDPHSSY